MTLELFVFPACPSNERRVQRIEDTVVREVASVPDKVRAFLATGLGSLLQHSDFFEALLGHLSGLSEARQRAPRVMERFCAVAALKWILPVRKVDLGGRIRAVSVLPLSLKWAKKLLALAGFARETTAF